MYPFNLIVSTFSVMYLLNLCNIIVFTFSVMYLFNPLILNVTYMFSLFNLIVFIPSVCVIILTLVPFSLTLWLWVVETVSWPNQFYELVTTTATAKQNKKITIIIIIIMCHHPHRYQTNNLNNLENDDDITNANMIDSYHNQLSLILITDANSSTQTFERQKSQP